MCISRYNSEGYRDPTAYEALVKVRKEERKATYKPLVYVCSPFSGNTEINIQKARAYCRYAINHNAIPLAPHLLFPQFMNDETERELAMFMNMVLLGKCDELWVFGDIISKGMAKEIAKAEKRNQTIKYIKEADIL